MSYVTCQPMRNEILFAGNQIHSPQIKCLREVVFVGFGDNLNAAFRRLVDKSEPVFKNIFCIHASNRRLGFLAEDLVGILRRTHFWPMVLSDGSRRVVSRLPAPTSCGTSDKSTQRCLGPGPWPDTPWVIFNFPEIVLEYITAFCTPRQMAA